ncbi:unnamed protein product [Psylliodes chrysocephalus]|uniref:FLYWCH-type domain-containing protein n=1 Tax=Psylliodes chrysocephalus TaxID=3402493 RepID=A0A9P0GCK0_9CUCU|nr:unnamed protein product [Psylliodes chrysocephala]
MELTILTERGKDKFSANGYLYVFDGVCKSDENVKFWRCERRGRCKARIHTKNNSIIKEVNVHTHDFSAVSEEVAELVTKIKKRVEEITESTVQVINECVSNVLQACQAKLPNNCAL